MKMGRIICLGSALVLFFATSSMAVQGSKFAAHVKQAGANMHLLHSGVSDADESGVVVQSQDNDAQLLTTTIHTANQKDLLIGVSLQSGLYTDTTVKGKNGSSEKAGAEAGVKVSVTVDGVDVNGAAALAYPTEVVFAHRVQELSATLGGVIESCTVPVDAEGHVIDDIVVVRDCVVSDEEIGLMLSTTSANHFNFVAPNLAAGDHTISVSVTALSSAEFENGYYVDPTIIDAVECENAGGDWVEVDTDVFECQFGTTDNDAKGWALVDVGSLTVEQVRATNNPDGINIDLDSGFCYDETGTKIDCEE